MHRKEEALKCHYEHRHQWRGGVGCVPRLNQVVNVKRKRRNPKVVMVTGQVRVKEDVLR
jgi:hypothetical protein